MLHLVSACFGELKLAFVLEVKRLALEGEILITKETI